MLRKSQKTLFLGQKSAIMGQYGPKKIFRKKRTPSPFNNYYFLLSCKKSENFNDKMLRKLQKTLFSGQKSAIMAQNGQIRFFFKNRAPSLFKLGNFLSSCKKSEKSNEPILRKPPDERTDERTDGRTDGHRSNYRTSPCR